MPLQLQNFDGQVSDISANWAISKSQIEADFETNINDKKNDRANKDTNGFIIFDDYKNFLGILPSGIFSNELLLDLSNIVHTELINLENVIDAKIATVTPVDSTSIPTTNKTDYTNNKKIYIQNKEKINGAIMHAKTQNDNYNNLVSASINLICGIMIIAYLIYKIYTPITIEEIKSAVKTTRETATNVAKQAQSSTNKIVSGK